MPTVSSGPRLGFVNRQPRGMLSRHPDCQKTLLYNVLHRSMSQGGAKRGLATIALDVEEYKERGLFP